jgi:hypothetical protein
MSQNSKTLFPQHNLLCYKDFNYKTLKPFVDIKKSIINSRSWDQNNQKQSIARSEIHFIRDFFPPEMKYIYAQMLDSLD